MMQLIEPPKDLPGWSSWLDTLPPEKAPLPQGFQCGFAHLSRARARYRAATRDRGVLLDDFRDITVEGYSGLVGLVLAFGAFEQYSLGLGLKKSEPRSEWFGRFLPPDSDEVIRNLDPDDKLFNLISTKTRGPALVAVQAYRQQQPYCATMLAAAVRHVFVHGILTPNANRTTPQQIASLSRYFARLLLNGIASDWHERLGIEPYAAP